MGELEKQLIDIKKREENIFINFIKGLGYELSEKPNVDELKLIVEDLRQKGYRIVIKMRKEI